MLREYNESKEEIKILKLLWNILINMVDIIRKKYERFCVRTIVDSAGILWLNEKHAEEGLDDKILQLVPVKYLSDHRKHKYERTKETTQ